MKKSFLQTLVVFGVFSIFLIGGVHTTLALTVPVNQATGMNGGGADAYKGTGSAGFEQTKANAVTPVPTGTTPNPLGYKNIDDDDSFGINDGIQQIYLATLIAASQFIGWIMGATGWLFDEIIAYTTVYPKDIADGISGSWKIVRDFANIVLIFSLLYLGIKTILEGNGFADKKILIGVIISAVLINFSFFFVKDVAFNISNTVGLQILQQANIDGAVPGSSQKVSYSAGFMKMVEPQTLVNGWPAKSLAENNDWARIFGFTGKLLLLTFVVVCLGIIFLGVSITLLYRFLIFIALIIASPVGLISTQIPWLKTIGKDWIDQLKKQTMYFPAFALVLYIVMYIVTTLVAASPPTLSVTDWNSAFMFLFNFLLIIGFMFGLLILPGKIGAAGADLLTQSGGYLKDRVKSIPRGTAQFGGRVVASGTARTGRYLVGNKLANLYGGKTEEDRKALQLRAQGTGFGAWRAQQRLKGAEKLKEKTFDIRNIDAIKKTKFGKGMGEGIQGYTKTLKQKADDFEKKKKEDMKRYGFDKLHETDDAKIKMQRVEKIRDDREEDYLAAESAFKASGSNSDLAKMNQAEKKLKEAELLAGKIKNTGENKYLEQNSKQWRTKINVLMSSTTREMIKKVKEETDKKWKEAGQSSGKKKKRAESKRVDKDLEDTPTPTPPLTT